jgi:hypothetical protein
VALSKLTEHEDGLLDPLVALANNVDVAPHLGPRRRGRACATVAR